MDKQTSFHKSEALIILPAFNEGKVIGEVLEKIKNTGYTEICVVDDGSDDQTAKEVQKARVQLLQHPVNRGAGAAVQTGILYAKKGGFKYVVLMDSDGQHYPADIDSLFAKMRSSGADIVIGNRFSRQKNSIPANRRLYNFLGNTFTNFFCKRKYIDTQSGFRLLNRKAIEIIELKNRGFGFCSEMILFSEKHNLKIEETPIRVLYSNYSLSKGQSFGEGVRTARSILWQVFLNKNSGNYRSLT